MWTIKPTNDCDLYSLPLSSHYIPFEYSAVKRVAPRIAIKAADEWHKVCNYALRFIWRRAFVIATGNRLREPYTKCSSWFRCENGKPWHFLAHLHLAVASCVIYFYFPFPFPLSLSLSLFPSLCLSIRYQSLPTPNVECYCSKVRTLPSVNGEYISYTHTNTHKWLIIGRLLNIRFQKEKAVLFLLIWSWHIKRC